MEKLIWVCWDCTIDGYELDDSRLFRSAFDRFCCPLFRVLERSERVLLSLFVKVDF